MVHDKQQWLSGKEISRGSTMTVDVNHIPGMEGKKILVLGFGRSGFSAVRLLTLLDAEVTVSDRRKREELSEMIDLLPEGIRIFTGDQSISLLDEVEMVIVSPGISMMHPLICHAREQGLEVIGEIELAYRITKPFAIPWIAITGTNGKSTTTRLVDLMLRKSGYAVLTGGNIGNAITDEIYSSLREGSLEAINYIVVELSSFQLESISQFTPSIASILNITPDHLDRYRDMQEYISTKSLIYQKQDRSDSLILNDDDPVVAGLGSKAGSHLYFFTKNDFRDSAPEASRKGRGAYLKDGWITIRIDAEESGIIKADEIRIKGIHNLENALAASLIASLCHVKPGAMKEILLSFPGLEHRMEFVDEIKGVRFYNDSKGTNIGSVIKSLESFEKDVILILGGRDKGGDFTALRDSIRRKVKGIVVIGEARDKIISHLGNCTDIHVEEGMAQAVEKAFRIAEPENTVLLSPGCASFDLFDDFEQRGRVFKDHVKKLRTHVAYKE
jgi:UDP-N-acetylmuramoylalanine--D-glutamate ligase